VVGSALRPVEGLRRGAERIGAGSVGVDRLPVPTARDEVHALATTLNGMLDRIAASQERQRDFVADAAHELRSPLASMRTQLEVAERLGEGGDLPEGLLPEVHRLSALVDDLLLLARSGAEAGAPDLEDVDLLDLAAEVAARVSGSRVPVRVEPRDQAGPGRTDVVVVQACHDDLLRAVANLVDNAVRHAATVVVLRAEATPAGAQLCVRDDGDGIPEQDRERVFDRFARRDDARDRDHGGSGLGLAITRDLVRRNGGDVVLEDADPGLRAVLRLPVDGSSEGPPQGLVTGG
jgi:signal transduction histidine kinase